MTIRIDRQTDSQEIQNNIFLLSYYIQRFGQSLVKFAAQSASIKQVITEKKIHEKYQTNHSKLKKTKKNGKIMRLGDDHEITFVNIVLK